MVIVCYIILLFTIVDLSNSYKDGSKELILLHTLWRHGDRSPAVTFPTDPFQEDSWTFGGTGWGQLSPIGMRQHFNLGKKIRERYMDEYQFLSPRYNSKEIYVRSTDANRTIISAVSNLMGQYSVTNSSSLKNIDYPDVDGWPAGFIPIGIHTVDYDSDRILNAQCTCPLRNQVWKLAETSEEVQSYSNREDVLWVLGNLTENCGWPIDINNIWIPVNSLLIEQIYYNDTLREKNTWFTDDLYKRADDINNRVQLFDNGLFENQTIINGHDVGLILRKIRGGPILNDIVMHMNLKLKCAGKTTSNCTWINGLKNYMYSAHDTTITALFGALRLERYVIKPVGALPEYSAAILLELYEDRADNDKPYFKLIYYEQENADFRDVTMGIERCPSNSSYCSFEILQKFADLVKPDMPIDEWCFMDLNASSTFSNTMFLSIVIFVLLPFLP